MNHPSPTFCQKRINTAITLLALSIPLTSSLAIADNEPSGSDDLWDLDPETLGEIRVTSIATGTETPIDKAAAVVTVFTAEDIAKMGATDIDQVLETVPGLHVNHTELAYAPKYVFRGITTSFNPQALLLINGIPITDIAIGNRSNVWGGMPVKSITSIEVIRGPGSSLYGAEAFAGVINIRTKSHRDITDNVGATLGSDKTRGAWLETSTAIDEIHMSLTLEHLQTKGWNDTVSHDAQTNLDAAFSTNVSLAPGKVNTGVKRTDARIQVEGDHWLIRSGYQDRSDVETTTGVAGALDTSGIFGSKRFNIDGSYQFEDLLDGKLDIETQLSYYHSTQEVENNVFLYPPGAFGGAFPDGFIGNPGYQQEQARFNVSTLYTGIKNHRIHAGTGFHWADLYEVTETKNFNPDGSPKTNGLEDVSDNIAEIWMQEEHRENFHLFLQDEWGFTDNWALTSGIRFDEYSDFGNTTNPRLALVWATTDKLTTKLLYGKAFRAPSLNELYVVNNPVNIGNANLKPEIIDTYEVAISHYVNHQFQYNMNAYFYEIKDLIVGIDDPATADTRFVWQNAGKRQGHGFELDLTYRLSDQATLIANYAFQKSEDQHTDLEVGEAPNHQIYGRADWQLSQAWHLSTQANWVGEQKRTAVDTRDPVDEYITVDMTLRAVKLLSNINASVSVKNLFDHKVLDPSPWAAPVPNTPNDYPMAGRSLVTEVSLDF